MPSTNPSTSSPLDPTSGGGFVAYNTHSLPVRWEDIWLKTTSRRDPSSGPRQLRLVALPATPGRTVQPILSYDGGNPQRAMAPFGISYWNLTYPGVALNTGGQPFTTSFQNNLFGLNRVPRTVDSTPSVPQWFAPFFFEDRRNVFYVTTQQSRSWVIDHPPYGYEVTNVNAHALTSDISSLQVGSHVTFEQKTPFSVPTPIGGGDPSVIGRYLQQGGNIHTAINSTVPVNYQGTALFPGGQVVDQSIIPHAAPTPTKK